MKRLALGFLGILLATLLTGCGTAGLIRRGDALMATNDPAGATRYYLRALDRNPDLAKDPTFAARLSRAQSKAHYNQAQSLATQRRWDDAVKAFTDSVQADQTFTPAREALEGAKREASKAHHQAALNAADQGNLNLATTELRHALQFDPNNLDAQDALDSAEQKKTPRLSAAQGLHEQAAALEKDKHWGRAQQALQGALQASPNHVLARVALWRAKTTIARATEICSGGSRLLEAKQLDQAIAELKKALDIWPDYDAATQLLATATARRKTAEDTYLRALDLSKQGKWDEAVEAAAAALQLFATHPQAQALLNQAKQQAAAAQSEQGRTLLAQGDLEPAEAKFLKALSYLPSFAAARQGLSEADYARGLAAERAGLWGNALVWYLQAADHAASQEYTSHVATARQRIFDRVRLALRVEVTDPWGGTSTAAAALRSAVATRLARSAPDVLAIVPAGGAVQWPTYGAKLELVAVDVRSGIARTENRVHEYIVRQEVPNPEIPRLRDALLATQGELVRAERESRRPCPVCRGQAHMSCPTCNGSGDATCAKCKGRKFEPCSSCNGTGRKGNAVCPVCKGSRSDPCVACGGTGRKGPRPCPACRGSRNQPCSACGGTGKQQCPTCRGTRTVACRHCKGTGLEGRVTQNDLRRLEHRVEELRQRLHREPRAVLADFPAEWPYVVQVHQITGTAELGIQVTDPATGAVAIADRVRKTSVHDDATITNPNPAIGLPEDPLELPTESAVRQALIDALAAEATSKLLSGVLGVRMNELKTASEAYQREGKNAECIEALVDLARLLEGPSPDEAAKLISRLKDSMKTER